MYTRQVECLDGADLAELLTHSGERRARLESHLDICPRCRGVVAAYARVADDAGSDETVEMTPSDATITSDAPPMSKAASFVVGHVVAGRWTLDRIVGEGGMGIVWAAHDRVTGRRAALKMLKLFTPELARRALREARVTLAIGHPNVLEVREVINLAGAPPILVMDLLQGESLDRVLARRGPLSTAETLAVLEPLVGAVRAAHARGVLHRDLKPQNVFFAREGGVEEAVVMLLDFGLAKLLGQDVEVLTRTGAIVGTPYYMAPEQLCGDPDIDRRADVWAIGAMAFEMLTGKRPLDGGSYAQLVRNAIHRAIKRTAEHAPLVPTPLAQLVDRMLAPERADRPELAEVHAALETLARTP